MRKRAEKDNNRKAIDLSALVYTGQTWQILTSNSKKLKKFNFAYLSTG